MQSSLLVGGGKENSCSVLKAVEMASSNSGKGMECQYVDHRRSGHHICYPSDLRKMKAHYPAWSITKTPPVIFDEITRNWMERAGVAALKQ